MKLTIQTSSHMRVERGQFVIQIGRCRDPERKLTTGVRHLSKDKALQLEVLADDLGRIDQVDKTVKALVRLNKPHWRLALSLWSNWLDEVPESVWELANMEELRLNRNSLKTISPAIVKLAKLRKLCIGWNPLVCFPEVVCKLEQLDELSAIRCQLSVLPSSFASLRNLLELSLGGNAFEQFPAVICELKSLRELRLENNKLSSLPRSFVNLRELTVLDLSKNLFKEFPAVVCELTNLTHLIITYNELSEMPLSITKLIHLEILNLSGNLFTSFPLFIGDLPRIWRYCVSGWFNRSARFSCLHK